MKIKSLLISSLFAASVVCPCAISANEVHAEAVYSMGLSIDTIDLPVNWIEPDYVVKLPVRVSNNPGISYLSFLARSTDNVPGLISASYRRSMIPFNEISNLYWSEFKNGVRVITIGDDVYYDANDILCYMKIRIPENAEVGDFYGVDFVPECVEDGDEFGFEKDGVFYNEENFGDLQGGGVRIIEAEPLHGDYDQPVTPENNNDQRSDNNEPQNHDSPVANNDNPSNNNDNNDSKSDANGQNNDNKSDSDKGNNASKTDKKEAVTTQKGTTVTTTKTKITTSTTGSDKKTTVSSETTTEKVKETKTDITEKNNEETEEEKKKNHIPEFFISGIVSAGVIIFLLLQTISKKKK